MKINTALILCAGYGKRLNPLTLEKPKPLLKINGLSIISHVFKRAEEANIGEVVIRCNTQFL